MELGDIGYLSGFRCFPKHPELDSGHCDYRAKPGSAFVFMLLGVLPKERADGFDPNAQLQSMGWVYLEDDREELVGLLERIKTDRLDDREDLIDRCLARLK